jgi:ATP-dependent DNA helicase RecQ
MERYAAGVGCRHRHLVSYFGERYGRDDCGACDYCLGELEAVPEAVTVARKILSCVARVGQRFGAAHVANVLCGSESEQVTTRGHHQLSTFGLLRDAPVAEVRGYLEQLTAEGLLRQTDEPYPVLALTDEGVSLLKNAGSAPGLSLARQRRVTKEPRRDRRGAPAPVGDVADADHDLFERLRAVRLRLARARNVPPYVIFHDTTLRELARLKPASVAELSGVYGIGASKAERFGEAFVEEINRSIAES